VSPAEVKKRIKRRTTARHAVGRAGDGQVARSDKESAGTSTMFSTPLSVADQYAWVVALAWRVWKGSKKCCNTLETSTQTITRPRRVTDKMSDGQGLRRMESWHGVVEVGNGLSGKKRPGAVRW